MWVGDGSRSRRSRGPSGQCAVAVRRHEFPVVLPGGCADGLARPARAQRAAPFGCAGAEIPHDYEARLERYQQLWRSDEGCLMVSRTYRSTKNLEYRSHCFEYFDW